MGNPITHNRDDVKKNMITSIRKISEIWQDTKHIHENILPYKNKDKSFKKKKLLSLFWTSLEDYFKTYFLSFGFGLLSLGFQPAVKPAEEESLPHDGVLRLEYPMVFIGEDYHLGWNTTELGCVKRHLAL